VGLASDSSFACCLWLPKNCLDSRGRDLLRGSPGRPGMVFIHAATSVNPVYINWRSHQTEVDEKRTLDGRSTLREAGTRTDRPRHRRACASLVASFAAARRYGTRQAIRLAGWPSNCSASYANWNKVQAYWNHQSQTKPLLKEVSKGTVFYTSPVVGSPGHLEHAISKTRSLLHNAAIERIRRYEDARMRRLLHRAEKLRDPKRNPDGYRSVQAVNAENAYYEQRNRAMRVASTSPDPTALLVIDEADRLKMARLEQVRSIFDHGDIGLV
jgi:hypothetical protein